MISFRPRVKSLRDFLVQEPQQLRTPIDEGDTDPEGGQHRGIFSADDAPSDHDDAGGERRCGPCHSVGQAAPLSSRAGTASGAGLASSTTSGADSTTPDLAALPTSAFELRVIPRTLRPVVPLPATDAEWQASLRRWPGRTRERVWRLGNHALENPGADVFRRFRLPQDLAGQFLSAIESERRRLEHQAQRQADPGARPNPRAQASVRAAYEFADRLRRVPAWVGLLSLLEDFAHTWDDPRRIPKRRWKRIYERENYRCAAPGCTRSATIEDHHIDYRSDMGSDEPWNQIALCKFHHHQGEHGRFAKVRGQAPLGLTWRLGIPQLASWWRNETRIDPQDGTAIDARTFDRPVAVR